MEKSVKKLNIALILALCIVYFISYLTRLNFSATMVEIIASGALLQEQAGMVGTALFITYGVGQLVSGWLGDKIKPSVIILGGLVLTAACNAILPLSQSYLGFIIVWGINGFAQAMLWPPIVKILSEYFDKEAYAKACVWITAASQLATVVIYLVVPLCISLLNWQSVFFFAALIATVAAVAWISFYSYYEKRAKKADFESEIQVENKQSGSLWKIILACGLIFILVAIAMQGFLKDGITSWIPTYLKQIFQMETTTAVLMNVVTPAFSICATYLAGYLYRKIFKNEVLSSIVYFSFAAVCCIPLIIFCKTNAVISLLCSALVVGSMYAANLMLIGYLPRRFQKYGKASTVSGITNACTYVGSASSSYGFAVIAGMLGWSTLIAIWCGVCVVAVIVLLCAFKSWKKHIS